MRRARRKWLLAAAAVAMARTSVAQPRMPVRRIGFLALGDTFAAGSANAFAWLTLEHRLRDLGYREGENLVIHRRHASGKPSLLKDAASELVKLSTEVVVAFGAQSVTAAHQASNAVPIVSYTDDLVALGLAATYAKPGGHVTGVSPSTSAVTLKQFEALVALVPGLRRVAWLSNPTNPIFSAAFGQNISTAGADLGVTTARFEAGTADALDETVGEIARQGFGGVLVPADVFFVLHRARLAAQLLRHRLPSVSLDRVMLDAGLLMTYGADVQDGIRRMASHIDKILRGTRPGEIPIEFIERFQLGINVRTANALGISIPQSILARADRVIE